MYCCSDENGGHATWLLQFGGFSTHAGAAQYTKEAHVQLMKSIISMYSCCLLDNFASPLMKSSFLKMKGSSVAWAVPTKCAKLEFLKSNANWYACTAKPAALHCRANARLGH